MRKDTEIVARSDGSRADGRAAGATQSKGLDLGECRVTEADTQETGVLLACEEYDKVALDSQGVIQRIWNLPYVQPRSWVEDALVEKMRESPAE